MKRLLLAIAFIASPAMAQQAWDTNVLNWQAPTTCTSGVPISNCPVTQYRVERSATATGAYAAVGTSTTLTYTHLAAVAGQNCYRVIAVAATGESDPSNVACKTNTRPAGPPSPPTNLVVVATTVFNLRQNGRDVLVGAAVGTVALNTACGRYPVIETEPTYRPVARASVHLREWVPNDAPLVAKCG